MNISQPRVAAVTGALFLATASFAAVPALAAGGGFVTVKSTHGYGATVSALKHSIKGNGLMVMGKVNQKGILSMTGLHLKGAQSFLVGNPRVGKKLFRMTPAVAAVVPARISVWVSHGTTYIGYFKPSVLMNAVSAKMAGPGHMLDTKFHTIVEHAAH